MPAFVFSTGYFIKFKKRNVLTTIILYMIFQFLYIKFSNNILEETATLQFTTPYWLLWYLLAYFFYKMLIPLIDVKEISSKTFIQMAVIFYLFYNNFTTLSNRFNTRLLFIIIKIYNILAIFYWWLLYT